MDNIRDYLKDNILITDGAFGTYYAGLYDTRELPEKDNINYKDRITAIHSEYIEAGARLLRTNTFASNTINLDTDIEGVRANIKAAVQNARQAALLSGKEVYIAADIGPIPNDNMFDRQITENEYVQIVNTFAKLGVNIYVFETFSDISHIIEAIKAVPKDAFIIVQFAINQYGYSSSGLSARKLISLADEIDSIDAVGFNCGIGPAHMEQFVSRNRKYTKKIFTALPNAGYPQVISGRMVFSDKNIEYYSQKVCDLVRAGADIVGGCCGTTPEFISALADMLKKEGNPIKAPIVIPSAVCSATNTVIVDQPRVVGERINPTGKKVFKQALIDNDMDYILGQALEQTSAGADILDVNVGLPGIDERQMMIDTVKSLQSVVDVPLQLDSTIPEVLDSALRIYNGKPIVNSVNGEEESLNNILPIVKKYGAAVIGLALDKNGIPKKAQDRVAIAKKIMDRAVAIGIPKQDIYIDCLTLTASAEQEGVMETLNALHTVKHELGLRTVLGVSNISFGLPNRVLVNHIFLTMAMQSGLDLAIINPNVYEMMGAVRAYKLLANIDKNSVDYIRAYASMPDVSKINPMNMSHGNAGNISAGEKTQNSGAAGNINLKDKKGSYTCDDLFYAVEKGLKNEGSTITEELLSTMDSMDIVNNALIPALDKIGEEFEKGTLFLPQLIMAAGVAQGAFEVIRKHMVMSNNAPVSKGKIVIATVKGDVHDIGKNIVKVLLENYGYEVIDLGKDVEYQAVVDAIRDNDAKLCGLSALMTTTLVSMKKTIELIHENNLDCKVMVGGAVLTPEYAEEIHADFYSKDAKESVDIAKRVLG